MLDLLQNLVTKLSIALSESSTLTRHLRCIRQAAPEPAPSLSDLQASGGKPSQKSGAAVGPTFLTWQHSIEKY